MKKLVILLLLMILPQLQAIQANSVHDKYPEPSGRSKKPRNSLTSYGVFLVPINYHKGNVKWKGAICVIPTKDQENVPSSSWYLFRPDHPNQLIGKDLSAMLQISQIVASPDNRYLAVVSVGEGHPILEVMDIPTLVDKSKAKILIEMNPYPGYLAIDRWRGKNLVIESDMLLTHKDKNDHNRVPYSLELDPSEKFILNISTSKLRPVNRLLRNPVKYYVKMLRHKKLSTRRQGTEALKALRSPSALPYLKKALKREKNEGLRKEIMKVIKALKN